MSEMQQPLVGQEESLWTTGEPTKKCTKCLKNKPLKDFHRHKRGHRIYRQSLCKECNHSYAANWYKRHPQKYKQKTRNGNLKRNHGIIDDTFLEMLKKQLGTCAICRKPETLKDKNGNVRFLAIDHDHKTGRIRGLLCAACNLMLGKAYDNPLVLRAAADYLEANNDPGSSSISN